MTNSAETPNGRIEEPEDRAVAPAVGVSRPEAGHDTEGKVRELERRSCRRRQKKSLIARAHRYVA